MKAHTIKLQILFLGLLLNFSPIYSQNKYEMSAGIGVPELINARIKYGQNFQVGACFGFISGNMFGKSYFDWSCAAEITYHFLGKSKLVDQPPWYVLAGLGYYNIPAVNRYGIYDIGFYPRLGRTLNFSKKSGLNLDIGLFLPISETSEYSTFDFHVLWSGNIGFFIRF